MQFGDLSRTHAIFHSVMLLFHHSVYLVLALHAAAPVKGSVFFFLPVIKLALQANPVLFRRPHTEIEVDTLSKCEPIRDSITYV